MTHQHVTCHIYKRWLVIGRQRCWWQSNIWGVLINKNGGGSHMWRTFHVKSCKTVGRNWNHFSMVLIPTRQQPMCNCATCWDCSQEVGRQLIFGGNSHLMIGTTFLSSRPLNHQQLHKTCGSKILIQSEQF